MMVKDLLLSYRKENKMTKKTFLVLILLGGLSSAGFSTTATLDGTVQTTTRDLEVRILTYQDLGPDYIQAEATMSGTVVRPDGSQGPYKVPVTLVYPTAECSGVGLVDVVNSVFYETFDSAGTQNDLFFPSLFPIARMLLGDDYIQDRGYVYALAQWNKLVIERQRDAGTLADTTLQIDRGEDGYYILSLFSTLLCKVFEGYHC